MGMQDKIFNLLHEPWIMVLNQKGGPEELSLLSVLERAHELRCLAGELPTQDVAILRLLLVTLYATFTRANAEGERKPIGNAVEAIERWKELWRLKRLPMAPLKKRLCHYEDRFFLFHPERPFYQVAGLDCGTRYTAAKLLGDLSESGNKVRLFPVRTGDAKYAITFAEAARWLIYLNAFDDTSSKPSVRGQKMASPGAGWLGKLGIIYARGINLFETLLLNFILLNDNNEPWDNGYAAWELEEPRGEERTEVVLPSDWFSLLSLQSRRLLLQREGDSVVGYRLLGGDFFPKENAFTEQMTLWRKDKKEDLYNPKRHDISKQLWRDFSALLAEGEGLKKPGIVHWLSILKDKDLINRTVTLQTAGVKYGDKDFFVTDIIQDSLTINANLISQLGQSWVIRISGLLSMTESCVFQTAILAADLAKATGDSDSLQRRAGAGTMSMAKAEAYYRMDEPFRKWLVDIDPLKTDITKADREWKGIVKGILLQLGQEMAAQAGEKAVIGRWVEEKRGSRRERNLYTAPGALIKFRRNIARIIEKGG